MIFNKNCCYMNRLVTQIKMNTRVNTYLIIVVITVYLTKRGSYGILLKWPVDTTAVEGERVTLQCATDLELTVFWYFKNEEIFYGGKIAMLYASRFAINSSSTKGEYHLVIQHATKWYEGLYKCGDDEGEGEKRSAWLTVNDHTTTVAPGAAVTEKETDKTVIIIIVGVVAGIIIIAIAVVVICVVKRQRQSLEVKDKSDTHLASNANETKFTPTKGTTVNKQDTTSMLPIKSPTQGTSVVEEVPFTPKPVEPQMRTSFAVGPQMSKTDKAQSPARERDSLIRNEDTAHSTDLKVDDTGRKSFPKQGHPESGVEETPTGNMKALQKQFGGGKKPSGVFGHAYGSGPTTNTPASHHPDPPKMAPRRLNIDENQTVTQTEDRVAIDRKSATDSLIVSVPTPEPEQPPDVQENTTSGDDQDKDGPKLTENKTVDREDELEKEGESMSAPQSENQEQKS